ncbi:MAG: hypothetical protein K0U29_02990 [Gammaproteobacteria bacterium]|nr:hypothetical protein [Gammaproteobacteria bacterium]MCH9743877.1 hypothetical protein [Gammaproteobacteria bacterium]
MSRRNRTHSPYPEVLTLLNNALTTDIEINPECHEGIKKHFIDACREGKLELAKGHLKELLPIEDRIIIHRAIKAAAQKDKINVFAWLWDELLDEPAKMTFIHYFKLTNYCQKTLLWLLEKLPKCELEALATEDNYRLLRLSFEKNKTDIASFLLANAYTPEQKADIKTRFERKFLFDALKQPHYDPILLQLILNAIVLSTNECREQPPHLDLATTPKQNPRPSGLFRHYDLARCVETKRQPEKAPVVPLSRTFL